MGINYERLKTLRKDNNYTQKQVADYLGITQSNLSKIENGERNFNMTLLDKLCLLYNCSPDYLSGKSDDYEKPKIAFGSDEKIDLFTISKMNQVAGYLKFLREIEEDINND